MIPNLGTRVPKNWVQWKNESHVVTRNALSNLFILLLSSLWYDRIFLVIFWRLSFNEIIALMSGVQVLQEHS